MHQAILSRCNHNCCAWWKILSRAWESLLSASLLVVFIKQHFGALMVKFSLNPITTQKMANLQDTERHLQIIVFTWSYGAYNQPSILNLLRWKFFLIPTPPKKWRICNTLSHASESSFSSRLMVPIIRETFWAPMVKSSVYDISIQKMANLQNAVPRHLNHLSQLV